MERDPFSPLVHLQISLSYWNQRRYEDAIQWAQKTLHLDPKHPHAREHLAAAYLKSGDVERYITESIKHAEVHGAPPEVLEPLKRAFAEGGRAGVVRIALDHAPKEDQGATALMMAILSGESSELDNAFAYLDTALRRRDQGVVYLAVGPQWDSLRSDPRFDLCLARMGLPRLPLNEVNDARRLSIG